MKQSEKVTEEQRRQFNELAEQRAVEIVTMLMNEQTQPFVVIEALLRVLRATASQVSPEAVSQLSFVLASLAGDLMRDFCTSHPSSTTH